jgi:hypothetical protein
MELKDFDFTNLCYAILISLVLHVFFLRKQIVNILDPWILMFINQWMIFSVFIYSFMENQMLASHFYYVCMCWFAFVLGLYSFYTKKPIPFKVRTILTAKASSLALKIYLFLFFINGAVTFYFMGIPFFTSGNRLLVEYAKLGAGFGLLSYINMGLQSILVLLSIKVWIFDGKRQLAFGCLFSVIIYNILNGGGKSGYLEMIMTICLGMYYMKRNYNHEFKLPVIFKRLIYILPFYILASFSSAVASGYESNALLALIRRIIGAAEGPYYYFVANSYSSFHGLNVFSYIFSNVLPYFGYIDKNAIELGVNLTLYSDLNFGTPGYGPNPTMFVIGHIAFGNWGVIYCLILGILFSYVRYKMKASFLIWLGANTLIMSMIMDATLAPMILFFILLLSPVFIFSIIIADDSLNLNKPELISIN